MMRSKREMEQCALEAARKAGAPIPTGEIHCERPDFKFHAPLGIEVSELLRPAYTNHGILPLAQENFQRDILDAAREACVKMGLPPVCVQVYFNDAKGKKQDRRKLTKSLVEIVAANYQKAKPSWSLAGPTLPGWFFQVNITSENREWWSGFSGGISLSQIPMLLASRIAAKERLLPADRDSLPGGTPIWLLLYSGVTIPRSVEMPNGIVSQWKFPFEFDRVFWFSFLEGKVVEIQSAAPNQQISRYPDKWSRIEFVCECGAKCIIDVELTDAPFGSQAYQHCGIGSGHCLPGRPVAMQEEKDVA